MSIQREYGVKTAYLFGSYAKGTATEKSDVDIIIDMDNLKIYRDYYYFCDELETELGTDVDVSSEEGMFPGIFNQVKTHRILLYEA